MTTIVGNTYPVRDTLRKLGGKWNKFVNGWDMPDDTADLAQKLVDAVGGKPGSAGPADAQDRVSYCRFGDDWALRCNGAELVPGTVVHVQQRNGTVRQEVVGAKVGPGTWAKGKGKTQGKPQPQPDKFDTDVEDAMARRAGLL